MKKITKPIRLIELFGGIGSQAKALNLLQKEGLCKFEHYKLVEFDKYAIKSYNAIHGTNFETKDITTTTADDLEIVDTDKFEYIMTYSFPCQDLSLAGKQRGMAKGDNTRSGLLWEVERILEECNELPQVLLMENVPQLMNVKSLEDFNSWKSKLEQLGYTNYVSILNAADYEIPQNRKRCFMVSLLCEQKYTFPKAKELKLAIKDVLAKEVQKKFYFKKEFDIDYEKMNNIKPNEINTIAIFKDGNYESSKRIQSIDGIARTLCARDYKDAQRILVIKDGVYKARKLIPLEYFRLMGFDDTDHANASAVNSNSQLYKQAGNSVVVNVLYYIFKQMM